MAINIKLYKCNADNRVVDKSNYLSSGFALNFATFKDSVDLHNPTFLVKDVIDSDYNYAEIEFAGTDTALGNPHRFYFVEVENPRTGIMLIKCRLDVLMTYKGIIKELDVILKRADGKDDTYAGNSYMYDDSQPRQVDYEYTSKILGSFDYVAHGCLILGAVGSTSPRNYQY